MATFSDFHVFSSSKGFPPAFIRLREPAIFCFFLSFWNDMGSFNRRECVGGRTHRSRQIAINGSAVSQSTRSQTYSNDGARLKEDPPPPIIKYWRHCFFVFCFVFLLPFSKYAHHLPYSSRMRQHDSTPLVHHSKSWVRSCDQVHSSTMGKMKYYCNKKWEKIRWRQSERENINV